MRRIFVDTSGWANLADRSEPYNATSRTLYKQFASDNSRLITTNYVMAELVALMTSPLRFRRPQIIEFISGLTQSPNIEVTHIDERLDDASWRLLTERPDKNWSLVDCSSFVLMNELGISEALTTDHHFEQADFVRLLK